MVIQWQDDVWENHHCLASNKWWSIDDKMMFERIIIIKHQIIWGSKNDKIMLERNNIIYIQHMMILPKIISRLSDNHFI